MRTYSISYSILPYLNICNQVGIYAVNISSSKISLPRMGNANCLVIRCSNYKSIENESKIWMSSRLSILGAESCSSRNHCLFPVSHAFLFVLVRVCTLVLGCVSAILFVSSLISGHKLKSSAQYFTIYNKNLYVTYCAHPQANHNRT